MARPTRADLVAALFAATPPKRLAGRHAAAQADAARLADKALAAWPPDPNAGNDPLTQPADAGKLRISIRDHDNGWAPKALADASEVILEGAGVRVQALMPSGTRTHLDLHVDPVGRGMHRLDIANLSGHDSQAIIKVRGVGMPDAEPAFHYQHDDDPHDGSPLRPGRHCGPTCDLYDPGPDAPAGAGDEVEAYRG